jgi:hypothetical protein
MYQARKNNKRSIFIFLGISQVPNDHLVDLIEVDFELNFAKEDHIQYKILHINHLFLVQNNEHI